MPGTAAEYGEASRRMEMAVVANISFTTALMADVASAAGTS